MDGLLINHGSDARTVVLEGEVDSHTAPELDRVLRDLGTDGDVVLVLSSVSFIDSFGLRTLLASHGALSDAGHNLLLKSPSAAVTRLLEITKLGEHLNVA